MADPARVFEVIEEQDEAEREAREAALAEAKRIAEALLFASPEPLDVKTLADRMPDGVEVMAALEALRADYATRGVNLARAADKWYFRTADDLGWLLKREETQQKKLTRAAIETLAIVAYHQPVTRAEIEDIRGVAISKGTLDVLLETGWIRLRGRRKAPGRPITYGTTEKFLVHFGLEQITDLPGLEELKGAGLFDGRLPPGFGVPRPDDAEALRADEDPLDGDDNGEELPLLAPIEMEEEAQTSAELVAEAVDAEVGEIEVIEIESVEISEEDADPRFAAADDRDDEDEARSSGAPDVE